MVRFLSLSLHFRIGCDWIASLRLLSRRSMTYRLRRIRKYLTRFSFGLFLPGYEVLVTWFRELISHHDRRRQLLSMGWPWAALVNLFRRCLKRKGHVLCLDLVVSLRV
ncbi:unnamed protein product [Arabidopsis lyrata]|nr:unnamed protein product [Arabidopsis lyrata]